MIIFPALVLVVLLALGASVLGAAVRGEGRGLTLAIGGGAALLLVVVAALGILMRGFGDSEETGDERTSPSTPTSPSSVPAGVPSSVPPADVSSSVPPADVPSAPVRDRPPDVVLFAAADGQLPVPPPSLDQLAEAGTALVEIHAFDSFERGSIRQCAVRDDRQVCGLALSVQAGADGKATTLVEVTEQVGERTTALRCRRAGTSCRLDVEMRGVPDARLVFGGPAPPLPSLDVQPASALRPGTVVAVTVDGLAPGETVVITQCAGSFEQAAVCGEPAPEVAIVADRAGRAVVDYPVTAGNVGRPVSGRCGRETTCGIAVLAADGSVRTEVVPVRFTTRGTADYDNARLLTGLGLGLLLAGVGLWLVRSTDWTPVGLPSTTDDAPDPF